jgi:hypothetical protein
MPVSMMQAFLFTQLLHSACRCFLKSDVLWQVLFQEGFGETQLNLAEILLE